MSQFFYETVMFLSMIIVYLYPIGFIVAGLIILLRFKGHATLLSIAFFFEAAWQILFFLQYQLGVQLIPNGIEAITNSIRGIGFPVLIVLGAFKLGTYTLGKGSNPEVKATLGASRKGFVHFFLPTTFILAGILFFGIALYQSQTSYNGYGEVIGWLVMGCLLFLVSSILFLVQLHQIWKALIRFTVRKGHLTPSISSPGRAVGFLFIPLFNMYWQFKVFYTAAKEINTLTGGRIRGVSQGIARAIPVLNFLAFVPYVNILAGLVELVLLPIFIYQAQRTLADLNVEAKTPAATRGDGSDSI